MRLLVSFFIFAITSIALADFSNSAVSLEGFYEITGTTKNYSIKDKDGFVDFSLVIPAMTTEEIINFDMGKIMSPLSDDISVASKKFQVPSNLSLPEQTESYFLSFTLQKLQYRAYLQQPGNYTMYALQGKFPIKEAINGFQNGKSIFEMVNLFTFLSGGAKAIEVKGPVKDVTLAVDAIKFDQQVAVTAPSYSQDKGMLAISLFKQGDEFYPVDLKQVLTKQTSKLVHRSGAQQYVLSLLMNNSQQAMVDYFDGNIGRSIVDSAKANVDLSQLSYTLLPIKWGAAAPEFLPVIGAPQFNKAQASVTVAALPSKIATSVPYATALVLSEVQTGGSDSFPIDVKRTLWLTTAMGWQKEFKIPTEVMAMIKKNHYSWDVLFLATPQVENDTQIVWDKVTHVTRNLTKF